MAPLLGAIPAMVGQVAAPVAADAATSIAPALGGSVGAGALGTSTGLAGSTLATTLPSVSNAGLSGFGDVAGTLAQHAAEAAPAAAVPAAESSVPPLLTTGGGYAAPAAANSGAAQTGIMARLVPFLQKYAPQVAGQAASGATKGAMTPAPQAPTGQVVPTQSLGPTAVPGTQSIFGGSSPGGIQSRLQQLLMQQNPEGTAV
jgi:hypothetical protein